MDNILKNRNTLDSIISVLIVTLFLCYPIMLNLLIFNIYKYIYIFILISIAIIFLKYYKSNRIIMTKHTYIILYLYITYLCMLFLSSFEYMYLYQYSIYIFKFLFFIFLLFYVTESIISMVLKLYAYLMVVIVICNIIIAISVFMFNLDDFITLTSIINELGYGFKVYFFSYYGLSNLNLLSYELYRFQGLSEEAGTFALSLLPAYFYFLYNQKRFFNIVVILGMSMSMSGAVPVVLLIVSFILFLLREYRMLFDLFLTIIIFSTLFYLNGIVLYIQNIFSFNEVLSIPDYRMMSSERLQSGYNRLEDITFYLNHLSGLDYFKRLFGEGSGSPFFGSYNHSISIGWLVKFVESGIIGGLFYFSTFLYIFILVFYGVIKKVNYPINFYILSFSILSLIFISTLRQPIDASFWHVTFFAFYFHYLVKNDTYK